MILFVDLELKYLNGPLSRKQQQQLVAEVFIS